MILLPVFSCFHIPTMASVLPVLLFVQAHFESREFTSFPQSRVFNGFQNYVLYIKHVMKKRTLIIGYFLFGLNSLFFSQTFSHLRRCTMLVTQEQIRSAPALAMSICSMDSEKQ